MNLTLDVRNTVKIMLVVALLVAVLIVVTAGVANAQGRKGGDELRAEPTEVLAAKVAEAAELIEAGL